LLLPAGLLAIVAVVFAGCGYRPLLRDARAPGGATRISVPLLANETEQVGIETELPGRLVDHLDRYRAIQVTERAPEAVLVGTVRQLGLRPTSTSGSEAVRHQAFRVSLVIDLKLERTDSDEVLWQTTGLRRDEDYDMGPIVVGEDILASEQLRRQAVIAAGDRLLQEGVELMMGGS